MIEFTRFASDMPGQRLLILGSIHGNEPCGTIAIRRLIEAIHEQKISLKRGVLTLAPNCNPNAYALKRRYVEHNLNRAFRRHTDPTYYEHRLMNILCPLLEECDVLLDIHSYTAGGPPFATRGPEETKDREEAFIRALGIGTMISEFEQVYANCGKLLAPDTPAGTTAYARRFGAIAATIECGQHDDPNAAGIAYQAIENAMAFCKLTDGAAFKPAENFQRIKLAQVRYRDPGQDFVKPWKHMEQIAAGEVIARQAGAADIEAPFDCFIVMPHLHCPVGEEWYYLGVEETPPADSA